MGYSTTEVKNLEYRTRKSNQPQSISCWSAYRENKEVFFFFSFFGVGEGTVWGGVNGNKCRTEEHAWYLSSFKRFEGATVPSLSNSRIPWPGQVVSCRVQEGILGRDFSDSGAWFARVRAYLVRLAHYCRLKPGRELLLFPHLEINPSSSFIKGENAFLSNSIQTSKHKLVSCINVAQRAASLPGVLAFYRNDVTK